MKTQHYNPSPLEQTFAEAILALKTQIQEQLTGTKITGTKAVLDADNPLVHFEIEDAEGDQHEIVIKVIQRIDDPPED
ncbi:MAG: hypothetical protein AAF992_11135 [Bacteroidota bacterium]